MQRHLAFLSDGDTKESLNQVLNQTQETVVLTDSLFELAIYIM